MSTTKTEFKVGDEALHGFRLVTIQEMEDGCVTRIVDEDGFCMSTGTGWGGLKCVPLTPNNQAISDRFYEVYTTLHKDCPNYNYANIHRWFAARWWEACQPEYSSESMDRLIRDFAYEAKRLYEMELCGVKLISRN